MQPSTFQRRSPRVLAPVPFTLVPCTFVMASVLVLACSGSSSKDSGANDGGGSLFNDSGSGGDFPDPGAGSGGDCSDAAKLVYVISDQDTLYSFSPSALTFNTIGKLTCADDGSNVNSMAVDRSGTAWVNYTNGKIYKVSTKDASCSDTPFKPRQEGFTNELGMGFSSNSKGSKDETLFVSDNAGLGLGSVDLGTFKLTALGAYTDANAGSNAELTGTGDARLYGFFTTKPAGLAQITKADGSTPNVTSLPTVNASEGGYAFSFWGGDFWFYTAFPTPDQPDPTTSVTHLETATGKASVALSNIGFVIVGAGVSTCAPIAPPPPKKRVAPSHNGLGITRRLRT